MNKIESGEKLDFHNVLIRPKRSTLNSRSQVDVECTYLFKYSPITWKGVPIIQLPSDMVVIQEIIHDTKPDVLIECGLAHGGSILYYENIMNGKGVPLAKSKLGHHRAASEGSEGSFYTVYSDNADGVGYDHSCWNTASCSYGSCSMGQDGVCSIQ